MNSTPQPGITWDLVILLEMQIVEPYSRHTNTGTLGVGPRDRYVLMGFPRDSDTCKSLETTETDYTIHQTKEILRVLVLS